MQLTTLKAYIEQRQKEFEEHQAEYRSRNGGRCSSITFEEETLIWIIQDWYGMKGEFTDEEYEYLYEVWCLSKDLVDAVTKEDIDDGE